MGSQLSQQTIGKAVDSFSSYFALLASPEMKGKKINRPFYITKKGKYNVIFQKDSFSKVLIDGLFYIRLTVGKFIQNNALSFYKNNNYVQLESNDSHFYYVNKDHPNFKSFEEVRLFESKLKPVRAKIKKEFKKNDVKINEKEIRCIIKILRKNYENSFYRINNMLDIGKFFNKEFYNNLKQIVNNSNQKFKLLSDDKVKNIIFDHYHSYDNNYIEKNESKIKDGMYMYIRVPKMVYDEILEEVEIKPIENSRSYHIQYKYKIEEYKNKLIKTDEKDNYDIKKDVDGLQPISIDLGVNNLFTIFSLNSKPLIINGRPIKSINRFYNKQIAKNNSFFDQKINDLKKNKAKKREINFMKIKKRYTIRKLFTKRNYKIKDELHKISDFLLRYCEQFKINLVIFGYIKGWKNEVNMGTINNQKFYGIPYVTIMKMVKYKCERKGIKVVQRHEGFTSKCDSLAEESVEYHVNYMGNRVKRGLYESSTGHNINADVNAAINIMRKYLNIADIGKHVKDNFKKCLITPIKYSVNVLPKQTCNGILAQLWSSLSFQKYSLSKMKFSKKDTNEKCKQNKQSSKNKSKKISRTIEI